MFTVGQTFNNDYPPEAAVWCNENNAYIDEVSENLFEIKAIPEPTEEELAQAELDKAKADRAEAVANIKVTVDGMVFDGDEASQTRMARAITASQPEEKTNWVLADNTIAEVTREQLQQALKLAGAEQTKLWVLPYSDRVAPRKSIFDEV